jgi:DNA helicase II / ATP-dependent DNA helicase PcrA
LSRNVAIIAAAGARKTQAIIDEAMAAAPRRVLITTYTNENLRQLERRISEAHGGGVPEHIELAGWFGFLLRDGVRPYQAAVFSRVGIVRGLNFIADRPLKISATDRRYHLDRNFDVWRDAVADLVYRANHASGGAVIRRLERIYDHVFIDEVQDLVGWDLEVLSLLFAASIDVTVVGDPRQHLYSTNNASKNKRYRGAGITTWFEERKLICERHDRHVSERCNQEICDFASSLFPAYPAISSANNERTGHDGIHTISRFEVLDYVDTYDPQILRYDKRSNTQGLAAMNFGVSKGSTFDRVLIFPTTPMRQYLEHGDPTKLKRPESLYVAVTRARHSVAFVL